MNIVHINLFAAQGGAAAIATALADSSRAAGHKVHVFAHHLSGRREGILPMSALEEPHFREWTRTERSKGMTAMFRTALLPVLTHPAYQQADIVHLHCINGGYFSYLLLPFLAGKPLVWTLHDPLAVTAHCLYPQGCDSWREGDCGDCARRNGEGGRDGDIDRVLLQQLKRDLLAISAFVAVAPSAWMAGLIQAGILRGQSVRTIPNGISADIFRPAPDRAALRAELGLPPDKKIVLFAAHGGLNNPMKGGRYFVDALRKLYAEHPELLALCIGSQDSGMPEGLGVPAKVLPFIADCRQMARYYAACDVFAAPSLTESFGLSICEAMACGAAVAAFDAGGVPELMVDGGSGLLVPTGDGDALTDAIGRLLADAGLRRRLGLAARERAAARFDVRTMCAGYGELYQEMYEDSRAGRLTGGSGNGGRKTAGAPERLENGHSIIVPDGAAVGVEKSGSPLISVVMPVYNGEAYLRAAIDSILAQTLGDFELILIDDGSTDRSADILRSYTDPRLRILRHDANAGLMVTRNRGLAEARGRYIAWMDCDDVSAPRRLEKQAAFLEAHAAYGVCGTWMLPMGGESAEPRRYPADADEILCQLLFGSPLANPTVMMRTALFADRAVAYRLPVAEDYDLFLQLAGKTRMTSLPEPLYHYRIHPQSVTRTDRGRQLHYLRQVQQRQFRLLGFTPSPEELDLHAALATGRYQQSPAFLERTHDWLVKLYLANQIMNTYPQAAFLHVLRGYWHTVRRQAQPVLPEAALRPYDLSVLERR